MATVNLEAPLALATVSQALERAVREAAEEYDCRCIVVSRSDGLIIAHNLADRDVAKRQAVMAATIAGTAQMAATDLGHAALREVVVQTERGHLVCVTAAEDEIVVCSSHPGAADLAKVLPTLRKLSRTMEEIISRMGS